MDLGLRWGTASIRKMYTDVKAIREKLESKIIRNENIPAWSKNIEKMRAIDAHLEEAEKGLAKLLRMKGMK